MQYDVERESLVARTLEINLLRVPGIALYFGNVHNKTNKTIMYLSENMTIHVKLDGGCEDDQCSSVFDII